jgi:hypothetical protein
VFISNEGMSRKHFQAIAHALKTNEPNSNSEHYEREAELFKSIVFAIAGACRSFNPRFNAVRFQRACGLDSMR